MVARGGCAEAESKARGTLEERKLKSDGSEFNSALKVTRKVCWETKGEGH